MFTTILILIISLRCIAPELHQFYILRIEYECNQLTWSNIDRYMSYIDIKEPEIVKAQIRHETGNLISRFCREQNNLVGMRLARSRKTTAIGEGNRMAVYQSWRRSLDDYKIWQDKYYRGEDYFQFLSRHGYAEDPYYRYKLRKIAEKSL